MHTNLSPHLHTEECNKIIQEMIKCHEQNNYAYRLFGSVQD